MLLMLLQRRSRALLKLFLIILIFVNQLRRLEIEQSGHHGLTKTSKVLLQRRVAEKLLASRADVANVSLERCTGTGSDYSSQPSSWNLRQLLFPGLEVSGINFRDIASVCFVVLHLFVVAVQEVGKVHEIV